MRFGERWWAVSTLARSGSGTVASGDRFNFRCLASGGMACNPMTVQPDQAA